MRRKALPDTEADVPQQAAVRVGRCSVCFEQRLLMALRCVRSCISLEPSGRWPRVRLAAAGLALTGRVRTRIEMSTDVTKNCSGLCSVYVIFGHTDRSGTVGPHLRLGGGGWHVFEGPDDAIMLIIYSWCEVFLERICLFIHFLFSYKLFWRVYKQHR